MVYKEIEWTLEDSLERIENKKNDLITQINTELNILFRFQKSHDLNDLEKNRIVKRFDDLLNFKKTLIDSFNKSFCFA